MTVNVALPQKKKLFRLTSIVALMTLMSRILGYIRDAAMAHTFGAGLVSDAFLIAFKIPNFFRRLFGEGAFSQAFVPVLAQYKTQKTKQEMQDFVDGVVGQLSFFLLLIIIVVEICAPLFVLVFAPGFLHDPGRYELSKSLLYILFPYIFFIALTAFAGAILNTMGNFAIPAVTPTLLNLCMIVAAWWIAPHLQAPIYAMAWAVIVSGVLQLLWQLPYLKRYQLLPRPRLLWRNEGVRKVLKLMIPALFGVSIAQLSLMIDSFFASFLPIGSITWLYYSDRLTYLPLGVIGAGLATVVLPHLSIHHARGDAKDYSKTIDWALRCVLLLGLPAAVGLFMLAGPLLILLIQHGHFGWHDMLMTRRSLMAFSLGLPGFMFIKILASAFYSRQDIKTPVKVAGCALLVNLVLNFLLMKPLAHAGLALATALSSLLNAGILLVLLLRRKQYVPQPSSLAFLVRVLLASTCMAFFLWWFGGALVKWAQVGGGEGVARLFELIVSALGIYFMSLYALGMRKQDCRAPS